MYAFYDGGWLLSNDAEPIRAWSIDKFFATGCRLCVPEADTCGSLWRHVLLTSTHFCKQAKTKRLCLAF